MRNILDIWRVIPCNSHSGDTVSSTHWRVTPIHSEPSLRPERVDHVGGYIGLRGGRTPEYQVGLKARTHVRQHFLALSLGALVELVVQEDL